MTPPSKAVVIALDLGGSWIKGFAAPWRHPHLINIPIRRWSNPAPHQQHAEEFALTLADICRELAAGQPMVRVMASTAGEVMASGKGFRVAGPHLGVMGTKPWIPLVETALNTPVQLINDADAFLLGCAERSRVSSNETVAAVVIGTGVGFSVIREGRWWKPFRRTNLLGSYWAGDQTYDQALSCVSPSKLAGGDLSVFFASPHLSTARETYLNALARGVATAAIANHLDRILIGGGLVDAAASARFDIVQALDTRMAGLFPPRFPPPTLEAVLMANAATLEGVLALGRGNALAESFRFVSSSRPLRTESPLPGSPIETGTAADIVLRLAENERAASQRFLNAIPDLTRAAENMRSAILSGGRVFYIGAGTSGRIGAMDAVEIPCTFGEPPSRFVSVIAGGLADASLQIENDSEEDISSVPDLLLLQPDARDIVIGISASATAFFVRSGLAFARARGSRTLLIHESDIEPPRFYDDAIQLHSGAECIQGSTRMLAGTATKKALNILSTTAMILLGKVRQGCMIDMVASNEKLRRRALLILTETYGIDTEAAAILLHNNAFRLRDALDEHARGQKPDDKDSTT